MDAADIDLRNATYGRFVALGRAPTAAEIAEAIDRSESDVRDGWRRHHDAHALVLDGSGEIRMANPFSAVRTRFRVEAAGKVWYANCAWDAFGIGAALDVAPIPRHRHRGPGGAADRRRCRPPPRRRLHQERLAARGER